MTERHRFPVRFFRLFDLILVSLSFALATALTFHQQGTLTIAQFLGMRTRVSNFFLFALVLSFCHLIFSSCGLYVSRRLSSRRVEILDVFKASTLAVACFMLIGSVFAVAMITIPLLAVLWATNITLLCGTRLLLRSILASMRSHGKNLRYMLVLGTNARAVDFARRIALRPQRGYKIVGFVDDEWPGLADFDRTGLQLVTNFAGLKDYLRQNVVDEVTIYLPFRSFYAHCNEVADLCQQHGITMRFNSDLFGPNKAQRRSEEFDGEHFITARTRVPEGVPVAVKRLLDIVISATVLLLVSPVLFAAAIAIKATSNGTVFFLQERVGLNKRRFHIFKLRTMVMNAEQLMTALEQHNEASGPVFKMKQDPRMTVVGKFLRASSIDELPQLLNVLRGDMSLVGPRPLPVRDFQGFNLDWQRRRFSVKPGITCLWQVTGRSTVSFDQWMLLDLQYMDEWSIWLDIKILFQTIPAVFRGSGAM